VDFTVILLIFSGGKDKDCKNKKQEQLIIKKKQKNENSLERVLFGY